MENDQNKMEEQGGEAGGATISDVLVNQGSRKVKLGGDDDWFTTEDVFPVSMKIENESLVNNGTIGDQGHEEMLTWTNQETNGTSAEDSSDRQGQRSSCCCKEEIKSLKFTVNLLQKQVLKQKQAVTDLKACLRNIAVSVVTFCDDDEGEDMDRIQEFSENEETSDSAAVHPQLLNQPDAGVSSPNNVAETQDIFHDGENCSPVIVDCTSNYSRSGTAAPPFGSSASLETCSTKVGYNIRQRTIDGVNLDFNDVNFQEDDSEDKDSSYVPDDESEEERDQELENEGNYHGASSSIESAETKSAFPCVKCSKSFKSKKYLQTHVRRVHLKKDSMVKCPSCPKVFKEKRYLKTHTQSVHEGIRYKCAHCPGKFRGLSDVRKHENQVHKNGGQSTRKCKICGIHLLNSEVGLRLHMNRMHKNHTKDRKRVQNLRKESRRTTATNRTIIFQCQLCSVAFSKREELSCHLSQVHGQIPTPGPF